MRTRATIAVLCWGLVAGLAGEVRAAGRLGREISDIPGMPAGMTDVGQDTTGYLWISSEEGLFRYDGVDIGRWGDAVGRLTYVATGTGNRVVAGALRTGLFEVDGAALRPVSAPDGARTAGPSDAAYDRDGRLWVAWSGKAWRREDGAWVRAGDGEPALDAAFRVAPREDGGVLVGTWDGEVWIVDAGGNAARIASGLGGQVRQIHDDPGGALVVIRFGPRSGLLRIGPEEVETLLSFATRSEGIARRGATTWVSFATGVWAVHDDGAREFLAAAEGFTGGGSLAVDREGGLWVASVRGLAHYPEPDTRLWTELSGLPHVYLRGIYPVRDGWFLTTWRSPILMARDGTSAEETDLDGLFSRDLGCADPWGGVRFAVFPRPADLRDLERTRPTFSAIAEWRPDGLLAHGGIEHYEGDLVCGVAADGALWYVTGRDLFRVAGPRETPVARGALPPEIGGAKFQVAMIVSRDGERVAVAYDDGTVCEAPMPAGDAVVAAATWRCEGVPDVATATDLLESPSGRLWLAAVGGGVRERTEDGWRPVPGELASLPSAIAMAPSPSGGTWVIGWRERWRVVEDPDGGPPTVVERLGTAQGVPSWQNARGLFEEADGTVWLALFSGLVRIPPSARFAASEPPSVTVTGLVADGREAPSHGPLELRHTDHSLELRWSALSYRDPARIRYRMRVDDAPRWTELDRPFARLAGFAPGTHRVELGASLDGRTWSDRPAVVAFAVRRAWYLRGWFVALVLAAAATALYGVYRARVAHLLRLERQRTRIAMDLHDEMGAGLGSAGLLVGLLGELELDRDERRRIGERAARQIRDLGSALSDIVWSLRPGTETLAALVLFLRQRASDLFPEALGTRVTIEAPDPCPDVRLGLAVRRNVQWIAVEALHNAARHANAKRVFVTMRPDGDAWVLAVRDDGRGQAGEDDEGAHGLGLESMRRRAREIAADLAVRTAPDAGTEVSVRFRP